MLREIVLIPEEFFVPPCTAEQYMRLNAPFYPRSTPPGSGVSCGIRARSRQETDEYSYGQKKKFFVSFGLAANSAILLLDEPTNGLDIPSKSQFRRLVAGAVTEDRTFIISTHQVRDMENLIDRSWSSNRERSYSRKE
jgi:ABC-2 type transport system ATP-binding protein